MELLQSTGSHPTADWIFEKMKTEFPRLSMGTVYRNLKILMEQGKVQKIDFGSTFDRFDANMEEHYHFVCERCGGIQDLPIQIDPSLNRRVNEASENTAHRHRIEFFGLCGKCRKVSGG
jgi:Fur family peroxide stress response transcriptional regulator